MRFFIIFAVLIFGLSESVRLPLTLILLLVNSEMRRSIVDCCRIDGAFKDEHVLNRILFLLD